MEGIMLKINEDFLSFQLFKESANILTIMVISNKKEKLFLLIGDLFIFALSLWISLALRGGNVSL